MSMDLTDEQLERLEKLCQHVVDEMFYPNDYHGWERGEDYSDTPGIKCIFEQYGDLETEDEDGEYVYEEGGNKDMRCYAIFIHKDSKTEEFPEHDTAYRLIIHRPKEEVCIYAWYDVKNKSWEFPNLWDCDSQMGEDVLMDVVDYFIENHCYDYDEDVQLDDEEDAPPTNPSAWPFSNDKK